MPPRTLSEPLVVAAGASAGAEAGAAGSAAGEVAASVLSASPSTETALPPSVTGTTTSMTACVPEPTPSEPPVEASPPPIDTDGAEVCASVLVASPSTEIPLPATVTGTATEMSPWVPDSRPSSPVVSAACATVAPKSVMPPARSVPHRARLMVVFMMSLS